MKKTITFLMLIFTITLGYSQEFLGVKVSGKLYEVVAKFKAKGFKVIDSDKNIIVLSGKVQYSNANIVLVSSPKSYTVWKFAVYLPEQTSWYSLKDEYRKYVEIFNKKYGITQDRYESFESPYYEGDGYELQAVRFEKARYISFWILDTTGYSVKIHKTQCIELVYENRLNFLIHKKEQDEQDSINF